jgi:hypothetical protein
MSENIGVRRDPLVSESIVDASTQEEFGLLTLGSSTGSCSASLLRNDWAITAAHCVELLDPFGKPIPDPARPGQFMLDAPGNILLVANWTTIQQQPAVQIETFRPYDIAIIRVAAPFRVFGMTSGYRRRVFQDGQFPYWGEEVPVNVTIFGRGINQFAFTSNAGDMASSSDGLYRVGFALTNRQENYLYWYTSGTGDYIAGGDSGGPTYAWVLGGYALMGVHSLANIDCLPGRVCGSWPGPGPVPAGYNPWQWAAGTPAAADAPVEPVWNQISQIMGPPPPAEPSLEPPPPGFIGVFGSTPPDYHPIWLYGIQGDGVLQWYRKDTGDAPWQGPEQVGSRWDTLKNVIPGGGNVLYGISQDSRLLWYQHMGFNDGSFDWKGPVEVGWGWDFARVFSGSDGILYAIQEDGILLWYRHDGFSYGGGIETWSGRTVIGSAWNQFRDVFSTGQGNIYAVKHDGELLLYRHTGYATGDATWERPRSVGTGWHSFRQIVPVGNGVILGILEDGKLLWYKDVGPRLVSPGEFSAHWVEIWEGPVEIGSGWQKYNKVVALIPTTTAPVVR